ncbi:hypothetical protein [Gordonia insulae]|uniref:Protein TolB n=1 Tax=Gordonia insulae TaxID=2420509 RepID=A0A3G8JS36_9ACTN|nr:hypothetical protein [Gordonia insulae]AZG47535.1 hypothetical protein D7316_04146 [Gordonia insulae]
MTKRDASGLGLYSEDKKIASELMTESPGAFADDNGVHVYYQQHKKDGFWLAGLEVDGAGEISSQSLGFPDTGITGSPSALQFDGRVLLFHRGRTDGYGNEGRLFFNTGSSYFAFDRERAIPGVSIAHNPCAAFMGRPLGSLPRWIGGPW